MEERCRFVLGECNVELPVKLSSAYGLLLCCTSREVSAYRWRATASQMTRIMECKYSPFCSPTITLDEFCVSFHLQRVAHFVQDGQMHGAQFRLLISSAFESTYVVDFAIGRGESDMKQIGSFSVPRQVVFASDFASVSGEHFVVSDASGSLSFVHIRPSDGQLQLVSTYYAGEPISMLRFHPPSRQLLLGSVFGTLMVLTTVEEPKLFALAKKLFQIMLPELPLAGSREVDLQQRLQNQHSIAGRPRSTDAMDTREDAPQHPPLFHSVIDGDYLAQFSLFLSSENQAAIAQTLHQSVEGVQELLGHLKSK